jgi:hypothetical protein
MRNGSASLLLVVTLAACADLTPRAEPPRTATVARDGRDHEPRARAEAVLVWGRDTKGALWTYQVQPDGASGARLEGVHVASKRGTWTWVTQTIDVETEPCDLSLGARHPAQSGTVTRASLVRAQGQEQLVVDPPARCDDHCPNELHHDVHPVGSVGPYLFVEQSQYTYACGAHGATATSFLVWDIDQGRPVDLLAAVPNRLELRAEASRRFADDERELGAPFGSAPPKLTELVPVVVDGRRLAFDAQLTIETCYACSDGRWSSYTRSVRIRTEPPPVLTAFAELPAGVATFLAHHSDLTLGGWSEAVPPTE